MAGVIVERVPRRKASVGRQCELLFEVLQALFRASRYAGPRPDHVLLAMTRVALAEYRMASPELRQALEATSSFTVDIDREADGIVERDRCWLATDDERRRLMKLVLAARKRGKDESDDEWVASFKTHRRVSRDEKTLGVLKAVIDQLSEPMPKGW